MEKGVRLLGGVLNSLDPGGGHGKIWEYTGLLTVSQSIICEDVGGEGTDRSLYLVFSTAEIGGTRLYFRN